MQDLQSLSGWRETKEHQRKLMIIAVVSFIIGGLLKVSPYIANYNYFTVSLQDMIGGPVISIFYITAIVLLLQNKSIAKILSPLANVGRLSMSNYLLQSIIGTLLFYSMVLGYMIKFLLQQESYLSLLFSSYS